MSHARASVYAQDRSRGGKEEIIARLSKNQEKKGGYKKGPGGSIEGGQSISSRETEKVSLDKGRKVVRSAEREGEKGLETSAWWGFLLQSTIDYDIGGVIPKTSGGEGDLVDSPKGEGGSRAPFTVRQ